MPAGSARAETYNPVLDKLEVLNAELKKLAGKYYGMSAQLKTVVDRFCAYNSSLNSRHLKSALLTVAWNSDDWTFDALEAHYKTLVRYINFQDCGMVLGRGCGTPGMTKRSRYPQEAYQLGKDL